MKDSTDLSETKIDGNHCEMPTERRQARSASTRLDSVQQLQRSPRSVDSSHVRGRKRFRQKILDVRIFPHRLDLEAQRLERYSNHLGSRVGRHMIRFVVAREEFEAISRASSTGSTTPLFRRCTRRPLLLEFDDRRVGVERILLDSSAVDDGGDSIDGDGRFGDVCRDNNLHSTASATVQYGTRTTHLSITSFRRTKDGGLFLTREIRMERKDFQLLRRRDGSLDCRDRLIDLRYSRHKD